MSNEPEKKDVPADDIEVRMKGFNDEFKVLLGKYELGLGSVAELTSDGRVTSKPVMVDARKKPEPEKAPEATPEPPGPKVEGGLANPDA